VHRYALQDRCVQRVNGIKIPHLRNHPAGTSAKRSYAATLKKICHIRFMRNQIALKEPHPFNL